MSSILLTIFVELYRVIKTTQLSLTPLSQFILHEFSIKRILPFRIITEQENPFLYSMYTIVHSEFVLVVNIYKSQMEP